MPTPLPPQEKADFIAIVQAAPYPGGPKEAERLAIVLVNYEDVVMAICRQLPLFAANNTYLKSALAVFDDNQLQAVSIYNNKILVPPLADPILVVDSTITEIVLNTSPTYKALTILGKSSIERITVAASTNVNEIYIGPETEVKWLDGSATGAIVNTIWLPFLRNTPSRLLGVSNNSIINQIVVEPGSYFGGYAKEDPAATCSSPVTNLVAGTITHNAVSLSWTPPQADALFTNIYYRQYGFNDWIPADDATGIFNGDIGYTFNSLKADTKYEFRVIVICKNGGWSAPADVSAQTICC